MQWHPLHLQRTSPAPIRQGGPVTGEVCEATPTGQSRRVTRAYIKDLRHRYSYELRPDDALDGAVRALAADLEARGLLEPGASVAPRFQPHLTLCRAAVLVPDAVHAAAAEIGKRGAGIEFDGAVRFGDGRIICLVPTDRAALVATRASTLARFDPTELDPAVHERVWTPHVTVAYAVPEAARADALALVEAALPLRGAWQRAQAWDLDVRPTACELDVEVRARPA
jgi:2'-5' RNA ligase